MQCNKQSKCNIYNYYCSKIDVLSAKYWFTRVGLYVFGYYKSNHGMPGVPTYSTGVAKNIYYNVCEMLSKIIRKEIEQN